MTRKTNDHPATGWNRGREALEIELARWDDQFSVQDFEPEPESWEEMELAEAGIRQAAL